MLLFIYFLLFEQAEAFVQHNIVKVNINDEIYGDIDGKCEGECKSEKRDEAQKYLKQIVCKEMFFFGFFLSQLKISRDIMVRNVINLF